MKKSGWGRESATARQECLLLSLNNDELFMLWTRERTVRESFVRREIEKELYAEKKVNLSAARNSKIRF